MADIQVTAVLTSMLDRIQKHSKDVEGTESPLQSSDGNQQVSTDSSRTPKRRRKRCSQMPETVYLCSSCPKKFRNFSSLRQHSAFHSDVRPFICTHKDGCSKAYKSKSELNRHSSSHLATRNFECNVCQKQFLRKQYLKNHLRRHSEPEAQLFRCKWNGCSKLFLNDSEVDCHILTYHVRRKSKTEENIDTNSNTDFSESYSSGNLPSQGW